MPAKKRAMSLRMRAEEKDAFDRAAELAGLNLTAWIINRLRQAAANELQAYGEAPHFLNRDYFRAQGRRGGLKGGNAKARKEARKNAG